ncbi:MAG: hypothetical protein DWQ36_22530 [Acidobacteria bacterium]|nr:MAG: hypothetical protein DWQ30_13740 [Acidobacteriota bacterium]REK00539.1 MAG: hypothetical protein DWQ36_22530 [Acidobacteriota bacterium]
MPPTNRSPRRVSLLFALVLVAAITGCVSRRDTTDPATIRVGTIASFETPNDLIARGSQFNHTIVRQLFGQLLREVPEYSAERPIPMEPELASSWSFSEDGLQLVFELRDDVVWSDGTPLTADDVVFSHQAQTSPQIGWMFAAVKEDITSVEALGPHSVRYTFARRSASQLLDANEGVVLPRHAWSVLPFEQWRARPDWFLDNLVTSGPFLLDGWERQQRLVLRRNPGYFEPGLPRSERVLFRFVPDESSLFTQFVAGEVDMIYGIRPGDVPRLRQEPGVELVDYPNRQYTFISWNLERPWFDDPRARRALVHAVDRQAIVDTLWFGYATVSDSPVVSWFWAHNDALEVPRHDPAAARRLLDEAGWRDSDGDGVRERDGVDFRFELTTNPGNETRWDAMQLIQAQLAEVGVRAELRQIEFNTLNAQNLAHDYDATVVAFAMDTSLDLSYAFSSDAIDNGYNFGSYRNAEVDRLLEENASYTDLAQMLPNLLRIQEILNQDQPVLFLWEPRSFVATRNGLTDVEPNLLNEFFNLAEWSKQE